MASLFLFIRHQFIQADSLCFMTIRSFFFCIRITKCQQINRFQIIRKFKFFSDNLWIKPAYPQASKSLFGCFQHHMIRQNRSIDICRLHLVVFAHPCFIVIGAYDNNCRCTIKARSFSSFALPSSLCTTISRTGCALVAVGATCAASRIFASFSGSTCCSLYLRTENLFFITSSNSIVISSCYPFL